MNYARKVAALITEDPDQVAPRQSNLKILKRLLNEFKEYREHLSLLNEQRITIVIDNDEAPITQIEPSSTPALSPALTPITPVSTEDKSRFMDFIEAVGRFDDPAWVNQLTNSMQQVGVQGFQGFGEDRPLSRSEVTILMEKLLDFLIERTTIGGN